MEVIEHIAREARDGFKCDYIDALMSRVRIGEALRIGDRWAFEGFISGRA